MILLLVCRHYQSVCLWSFFNYRKCRLGKVWVIENINCSGSDYPRFVMKVLTVVLELVHLILHITVTHCIRPITDLMTNVNIQNITCSQKRT